MTNHEIIFNYINQSKLYNYKDLISVAGQLLKKTTPAGRQYAVMRFIQIYCNAFIDKKLVEIPRKGDPRKVFDTSQLKVCTYQLTSSAHNLPSVTDINRKNKRENIVDNSDNNLNYNEFIQITSSFQKWLHKALHEFSHEWIARSGKNKSGMNKGDTWKCSSLFDAYEKYVWPASIEKLDWKGRYFDETEQCLDNLKCKLNNNIKTNDSKIVRMVCHQIFEWGGVDVYKKVSPHIKKDIPDEKIIQHIIDTQTHIHQLLIDGCKNLKNDQLFKDRNGYTLLLDSGTTKLYSLICDDFIIYDGRVASALGFLVKKWWSEEHPQESYNEIPDCLKFSCDKYNTDKNKVKLRDPNPDGYNIFSNIKNTGTTRIKENIYASWLLRRVLESEENSKHITKSRFASIKNKHTRLRAFEAALFMVGYYVN